MDIAEIARAAGVELGPRLEHGENNGTYSVTTRAGARAVLKVLSADGHVAIALVAALRARGYSAPAVLEHGAVDGVFYEITELVPGRPVEQVTPEIADQLVALVDLQRGVGLPGRGPWLPDMIASLTVGCTGYCELAALRTHDPDLLARLQEIARASHDVTVATGDVVHYDFSPYNMLAADGRITGVVDWHGATSGDAAFDLVTSAYYALDVDVRDRLLDAARDRTDPRALQLYAAHMVLRQVDWCLRFHDDLQVEWFTALGRALLAAVGAG